MSRDYFNDQLKRSKAANQLIEKFLRDKLGMTLLKDISNEEDGKTDDIDWVGKRTTTTPWVRIEVKERYRRFRDILIETKSSVEADTPGWIYKSKAHLLAYLWIYPKSANGFVFRLPALRAWWESVDYERLYERVLAPNPPKNPVYHTENYAVPFRDIPDEAYEWPAKSTGGIAPE